MKLLHHIFATIKTAYNTRFAGFDKGWPRQVQSIAIPISESAN